jgi:hypothetical protein
MNESMVDGARDALPGELCMCGRQAIAVFSVASGLVGTCGVGDGGDAVGPCPFCSSPRKHFSESGTLIQCPQYRLRPGGER